MEETARAHVIVSGRVQGVFFRAETKRAADRIGVAGWVRNRPEGTVEAVFEGEKKKVEAAVNWCRQGSPASQVTNVAVIWEPFEGTSRSFEISYF